MTAKEQGLPELPEPAFEISDWAGGKRVKESTKPYFSADHMRAYALAALASDTGGRGEVVAWRWPGGHWQDGGPSNRERAELSRAGKEPEYAYSAALRAQPASPPESGGQGEAVRKVIAEMNDFLEQDAEVWLDTLARWRDELAASLTQGGGNER